MRPAVLRAMTALLGLAACLVYAARADAHTPMLNVLAVKELSGGDFVTSWKRTQGIQDVAAAYDLLRPVFPEHCRFAPPRLRCGERGLAGRVGFEGLADLSTAGMIEIQWADGAIELVTLSATQPHVRVSGSAGATSTARALPRFVGLGVTHIWLGLDHLLFVLGLLWFLSSWPALLKAVTAFTVAHSVTLGAATFGLKLLPATPVEAVIALSIAFVAVEIARESRGGRPSLTRQKPWLVAFSFGLLHGFGFASALTELEIPRSELPLALLGFNAGVELGQLLFVGACLALRPVWCRLERAAGPRLPAAAYYAMGTLAMYWFFERIAGG